MESEITLNDLVTLIYLAPAIVYVDDFYRKELRDGTLRDTAPEHWYILAQADLLDNISGRLTPLGNTVFGCVDLIRYYMVTGVDMAGNKKPEKKDWQYELLRKGLGQYSNTIGIEYVDFLSTYANGPITTCLDIGGGSGHYLELVGERYDVPRCILVDKNIDVAFEHFDHTHPNSDRYNCNEADIGVPMNIVPYKADLVLMNEVLHLNDDLWWARLMSNALTCSHPRGQICIGEVQPESAFDWRMKAYTDHGHSLSMHDFMHWINMNYRGQFEEQFGALELDTHWFVILTKREYHNA